MLKKSFIGYVRSADNIESTCVQKEALKQHGCGIFFADQGKRSHALKEALAYISSGNILIVHHLSVIGHSVTGLIRTLCALEQKEAHFQSIQEGLYARLSDGIFLELEKIISPTRIHPVVRVRGRSGGRQQQLDPNQHAQVITMYQDQKNSVNEICHRLGISRSTLYRYIKRPIQK